MRWVPVVGTATVVTASALGWAAVASSEPGDVAARTPVLIRAASIDADRVVYRDTVAVSTAAGPVQAMELGLEGATFHGVSLDLPCVPVRIGGLTGGTSGDAATAADLTVYATDLVATIDGTRVRISSTDAAYPPPANGTVLVADGTLTDPAVLSVITTASSLRMTGSRTVASFCSPSGRPQLEGGVPLGAATPTDEPSPTEEPSPTTDPSPTTEPSPTPEPSPTDEPLPTDGSSSAG